MSYNFENDDEEVEDFESESEIEEELLLFKQEQNND